MTEKNLAGCPSCGCENPQWKHNGKQVYPAKYAGVGTFKSKLETGEYEWCASGDTFGTELFTCSDCGSTVTDSPSSR